MEHADVLGWVRMYESAWRSPGTDKLGGVFTDDVSYLASPWDEPLEGLAAIAEFWDAERDGPYEEFTLSSEVVAVDGSTAVVRAEVDYVSTGERWRDLWILRFADDGRCSHFEEWPIAPEEPDVP
jgi:SnoaL-like domain